MVPAWHSSDSDSTSSHDIKSIKTHCGTFSARLDQKSCFGCQTNLRNFILYYKNTKIKGEVFSGYENIDSNIFFKIKESKITRGHNFMLVKKQSRLDVRKYSFFTEDHQCME